MPGYIVGGIMAMGSLGFLLAGCAPPESPPEHPEAPAGLELRVSAATVSAGGPITLTLVNRTDHSVGYNLCPASLERRQGEEWVDEAAQPAEVCTMELRILPPGDSADYPHTIPAAVQAGDYRFRVGVEWPVGEGRVEVRSGSFTVR